MSQQQFFELLEQAPRIKHLWDKEERTLDVPSFENELYVLSSGEVQIAKFFAALWFNDNSRYSFDIVDAAAKLGDLELALIMKWIANPFWP